MLDLKPACARMSDVLAGVADDQFDRPTPCTEYRVRDLIDHVDQVARGFAAVAGAAPAGDETTAAHVRALGVAWDDPAAWRGSTDAGGVDLPNDTWGRIALTEMVVHGWDLATATGRSTSPTTRCSRAWPT